MNAIKLRHIMCLLVFAYLGWASAIIADNVTNKSSAPQYSDWSEPANLGSTINSSSGDRHPAISGDRLRLYFSSNRPGGLGGDDLWVSQRASEDAPWGTPQNLGPIVNTSGQEYGPTFSRDGHWLYFISSAAGGLGGEDIWVSYRENKHDDFGWQPPSNLGAPVNSAFGDGGPTLVQNDDVVILYFASDRPGGIGNFDIYSAPQNVDGSFGPVTPITELNTVARDTRTAISRNGKELFIASERQETIGANDLWVSTRASTDDPWSSPVNLGSVINTSGVDTGPALSSDNTTLFFASDRPGGFGALDLYMSTRYKK